MTLTEIIYLAFAGVTIGGAATLAFTRNVVHAVFLLFVVLFGVAGLYVLYGAEFLAMSQVIVYVGGILVILLFGVMLTHKIREFKPKTELINLLPGLLVAVGLLIVFVAMIKEVGFAEMEPIAGANEKAYASVATVDNDVERIGAEILTDYLLPFEAISVLLLAVLIGAAYLARKAKNPEGRA